MQFHQRPIINSLLTMAFIVGALFFQNCSGSSNFDGGKNVGGNNTLTTKGGRELGMDILDIDSAGNFANNVALAKAAGSSYMILNLAWKNIESSTPADCTTPGTYTDWNNALATLNSVLPATGLRLSLSILPISTNINLLPSNLASRKLDDSLVICRYQKMLSFVFSKIPSVQLVSLQFGNEIDAYASANQAPYWNQYLTFFSQVSATAKAIRSGLRTSVVSTLYGATGKSGNALAKAGLQQIYAFADNVVVTYYPLNTDFTVKNPSVIDTDFADLVSLYPNKGIFFNEIGFPSGSTYDGSSENMQASFVTLMFQAWDKYPTQIAKIAFLRLNDIPLSSAQNLATSYGLGGNNNFIEYLQTLGLRTYAGVGKMGYVQVKTETANRGW